jgi:hypothetical protein
MFQEARRSNPSRITVYPDRVVFVLSRCICRRISVYNLKLRHDRFLSHRVLSVIRYRPVTQRLYIGFLWLKIREQVADSYQRADEPSRNLSTKRGSISFARLALLAGVSFQLF